MYVVYKITNLINNKCYIGSSVRVEKRWQQHINASKNKNNPSYNYPLQRAIRKYGIDNFSFEILFDDFNDIHEMEYYEEKMINEYNSLTPNGYNQTKLTHSNNIATENCQKHIQKISQKCAKVDIYENIITTYKSYHDAARQNGYDGDYCATRIRKVCKGITSSCNGEIFRDLDENNQVISKPIKRIHGKTRIIGFNLDNPEKEIYFNSISEAAKVLNTDRCSIGKCIHGEKKYSHVKGYVFREIDVYGNIIDFPELTIEDVLLKYNKRNPIINGVRHSISEWCKIYDIKVGTVNARIKRGWDSVRAITTPVKRSDV